MSEESRVYEYDRNSEIGNLLKSRISDHLLHFFPHLHDRLLTEYITVLVCNGKTKNQARDDLEDFLGEKTQEFVSWLWKLLSKIELELTASKTSRDLVDCDREDRVGDNTNRKFSDLQRHAHCDSGSLMGKRGRNHGSSMQVSKSGDRVTSEHYKKISIHSNVPLRKLDNGDTSMKLPWLAREHQIKQVDAEKAACAVQKDSSNLSRRLPACVPGRIAASEKHLSSDESSEDLPLKPSLISDNKLQRSVWDRLGKPQQQAQFKGQRGDFHVMDKYYKTRHTVERNGQCPPLLPTYNRKGPPPPPLLLHTPEQVDLLPTVTEQANRWRRQDHWSSDEVGSKKIGDGGEAYNVDRAGSRVLSVTKSNVGRKRHFGEISENSTQATVGMPMKKTAETLCDNVSQFNEKEAVPPEISEAIISQMDDVKLRLRQMEIEMCKLRSKQIVKTDSVRNSDVVIPKEDDIDSRTVVVTNVHNKATKEILSMYFLKCGYVTNVNIDDVNALSLSSARSACITFENKEAADKALAYSGASFFSRPITVVKKVHSDGQTLAQSQTPCKRVAFSLPKSITSSQKKPVSGFNRQWRRPVTSEQTGPRAQSAC